MNSSNVRFGRDVRGHDVLLDLYEPYHVVVQGMSRSGKSNLMYCLLADISSYDHVVVAGCDPTGILLGAFSTAPGESWRSAGAASPEVSVNVLSSLVSEMDRRIDELLTSGSDAIRTFSRNQPLIVVVMEEYPGLLSAAEAVDATKAARGAARIAPNIERLVQRLVQESAKVGVRVVILAQRAEASILGGAVRSNLAVRVTLRVDNPDSVRLLHPHIAHELLAGVSEFSPGVGIVDRPGATTTLFRADVLPYEEYVHHVTSRFPRMSELQESMECEES